MTEQPAPDIVAKGAIAELIVEAIDKGSLEPLESRLSGQLETDPGDLESLRRLALLYRQKGDLRLANRTCARLAELDSGDVQAAWLAALCAGRRPTVAIPDGEFTPAPFVVRENFLPAKSRQQLLDFLQEHESELEELKVQVFDEETGKYKPELKISKYRQLGLTKRSRELSEIIRPFFERQLLEFVNTLGIEPFRTKRHDLRMAVSPDGGYGRMHMDTVVAGTPLVYLYYFHTHPKAYTGGHLLLYDQDLKTNQVCADHFTTIRNADNKLVVFLPHFYHQATTVRAKQPGSELSRIDARLSVAGFVRADSVKS